MKKSSGFTLVELIVVMSALTLLIGIVTYGITNLRMRTRDATRKTDMIEFQGVLIRYKEINKSFPNPNDDCPTGVGVIEGFNSVNDCLHAGSLTNKDFRDPINNSALQSIYRYAVKENKTDWEISAQLENSGDKEMVNDCVIGGAGCQDTRYEVGPQTGLVDTSNTTYTFPGIVPDPSTED